MASLKKMIKALMCIEDLQQGTGTILQVRKGIEYTFNKISALKLVFSGDASTSDLVYIKEVVDSPSTMIDIMTDNMVDIIKAAKGFVEISGLVTMNDGAGGKYYWNSTGDKATHNGLTIIDPTHSVTIGDTGWYTDQNTGTTGTWIRVDYMLEMAATGKAILKAFGTNQDVDLKPSGTGSINSLADFILAATKKITSPTDTNVIIDPNGTGILSVLKDIIAAGSLEVTGGLKVPNKTEHWAVKRLDIGDWNMDTADGVAVAHGLTASKIMYVLASVVNDSAANWYNLSYSTSGGLMGGGAGWDTTNINLTRVIGGGFDNAGYTSTSYNRGTIFILHLL